MAVDRAGQVRGSIGRCVYDLIQAADAGAVPPGRAAAEILATLDEHGARLLLPAPQLFDALELPSDLERAVTVRLPVPTTLGQDFGLSIRHDPAGRRAYLMRDGAGFDPVDDGGLANRLRELLTSSTRRLEAEVAAFPPIPASPAAPPVGEEADVIQAAIDAAAGSDTEARALLAAYCEPCFSMSADTADDRRSRFGGVPYLPAGTSWPRRRTGRLLHFIAQIDLRELPRGPMTSELPADGMLHFFYDATEFFPETPDASAVLFVPAQELSEPLVPPADAPTELIRPLAGIRFTLDASVEVYDAWRKDSRIPAALARRGVTPSCHRFLGLPEPIQGDPRQHMLNIAGGPCRLLLQIDCGDPLGFDFADSGRIYFLIGDDDLGALRFDRARVVLDSS